MTVERFSRYWAGNIFGTNTGRFFLKFDSVASDALEGTLRLNDTVYGIAVFKAVGTYAGGTLELKCEVVEAPENIEFGVVTATAKLVADGSFHGEWTSSSGTGGPLSLYPHSGVEIREEGASPTQTYTATRDLGALRITRSDLERIVGHLETRFPESRTVVSYIHEGTERAQFVSDFLKSDSSNQDLRWLKLSVNTAKATGHSKAVTIDLGQSFNRVMTNGTDESWVLGEAEALAGKLRPRLHKLASAVGKHRVNINQLILVAAVIVLPELELLERAAFAVSVIGLLLAASAAHSKWIPHFSAALGARSEGLWRKSWPSLLSWIITITAGVGSLIIYDWLR
ncbi:hypothetical protein [Sphingomicrobium sediminis]|uniref:Uncharacterized protein n=1 Tax=Sphingomicrobium sediminis TaxID=2950949 RepID=A0A9X2J3X7_9SPHN|nr:hypothetical protein [Sphingomicrobium sediminis]MCM8557771.1 hypothetical protein [Sphingomicrobium sediminis]